MTDNTMQQSQADAQKAYDAAVEQMTDRHVYERVRAAHPHANTGPDALKAMQDDYNRLKAEADAAKPA